MHNIILAVEVHIVVNVGLKTEWFPRGLLVTKGLREIRWAACGSPDISSNE